MQNQPSSPEPVDPAVVALVEAEIRQAVETYEAALGHDDLAALDTAFVDAADTVRADARGVIVGHGNISAFRATRGGAPTRSVTALHVRVHGRSVATAVAQTVRTDGTRGLQTQVWERGGGTWRIRVAHVSAETAQDGAQPSANRASGVQVADDVATWRIVGDPLVVPTGSGALDGVSIAVKDVVAVAGHRVGHGNPVLLEQARAEVQHAEALARLLRAGAGVRGIARTDELAFSLSGTNVHYGSPQNPWQEGHVVGGSTSGPASAVARGLVDLGLGTDTAGSIRVPASYCGLHGLRTTHGTVPTSGVDVLAPSFDTVGLLARDASLLHRATSALLAGGADAPQQVSRLLVDPTLLALADPEVGDVVDRAVRDLGSSAGVALDVASVVDGAELVDWCAAFRLVQAAEAWAAHGGWVSAHPGVLGPGVAARFAVGATAPPDAVVRARVLLGSARARVREALPVGTVLLLPATSSPAPAVLTERDRKDQIRSATLRLTCLASIAGLPAAVVPAGMVDRLPVGLCLLGSPGADLALTAFLADLEERRRGGAGEPETQPQKTSVRNTGASPV